MKKSDLLRSIRSDSSGFVDRHLPADAEAELQRLIGEQRCEVDVTTFLMYSSIRESLGRGGTGGNQSDREASEIMALLCVGDE
ncbi:hypothetical protein [Burkholderia gladioli]|uniref:Uncharacterized protein n=1 Tax=Burkholderia gladioli TaxID=28095 RepID=A0AAW3F161_BURGA|nr:hypothetical protein [Burkholderia gladioli]AJW96404.1 hypothetical protein BM43_6816 [Burkholderia gladioli]ASD83420.1 hypothetical protein CEJ98_31630 [Burkholderia gladioli pv. gladioli]AWY50847.1 hypothetical protein A8H28_06395 [Burkholderia gladioli pv. gladioli]KGC14548.1 hypothetical protein DM48_951 [Burkholderia gladioli]MBA1360926.1 hypothetical protein [Burkholderia gladioli]